MDTGDDITTFLRPDDTDDDLCSTPHRLRPRIPLDAGEDLFACRRPRIPLDTGDDLTTFLRQDATDEVLPTHHRPGPSNPRDAGPDHSTRREPRFEVDAGKYLTTFPWPYATDEDLSTQDDRTPVDVASPTQDNPAPPDGGPYPCFKPRKPFLPPCSTVLTSKERSDFCSDVLSARSRFGSLLFSKNLSTTWGLSTRKVTLISGKPMPTAFSPILAN
jgi:hypothetical protein